MLKSFADGGAATYRVIDEGRIIDMLLSGGWPYELRYGNAAQAKDEAQAALDRCVAIGLPFETAPDGARLFDSAEVINFINWSGLNRLDPTWEQHFLPTGRRMALDMHPARVSSEPPNVTALKPKRFSITIEREYDLRACPTRSRVRLRLPLPIEDGALADLDLVIQPPSVAQDAVYSRSVGRLDAILHDPIEDRVTLGVRASFTARPLPLSASDEALSEADRELYTRPSEGLVQITPRIKSLSESLASTMNDPAVAVEGFWRFIIENMICSVIRYDQLPASEPLDWALDRGWCDCQLGSALFVALCRARGIPARINSGYLLYQVSPRYHYWVEAWVPPRGWLPFDLLSWGLSVGGREAAWRDYFFAGLDYRCRTERLPRVFTGMSPMRLPAVWQILPKALPDGCETGFWSPEIGDFVYVDRIRVHEPALEVKRVRPG